MGEVPGKELRLTSQLILSSSEMMIHTQGIDSWAGAGTDESVGSVIALRDEYENEDS
jgi:hypothetical protein